ncbi:MAG: U32 family peptidase, partial [Muribaculaceae bacterium]|nr:U32 family peptidase [Muribaculaceae bacterium]
MCQTPTYSIELLAPARDKEVAIEALRHGADAVYMGASSHGARAAAGNPVADIASVADYAHRFGARVYVTVNTLVYDRELHQVERLIRELYRAGADALIVQDLGVLRLDIPPIALHASTQCDIRTPATARFLQDLGFSQLVLPRELSADEIRAMRQAVTVPLEAFVHGALCVSYSGDCYASQRHTGRSANRGECAQLCRLPYDLTDGSGRTLATGKHLLSLRDLNRLGDLRELIDAGVSSLKIEGRLKDAGYVKNVVAAYDRELKKLGVRRSSRGQVETDFDPDPARSFNRGFTSYFFHTPAPRT